MGITDKHVSLDETGHWPAELRFPKKHVQKLRRQQSPSREVSPVPSYFSEPVTVQQRRDVTGRLPPLIRGANLEEDDDGEDAQSLKSLPTVMRTLTFDPEVNRLHRKPKAQIISDLRLPPLLTCNLLVKGTTCTRVRGFLPAIRSKRPWEEKILERPPCRAGRRPEKTDIAAKLIGQPQNESACEGLPSEKMLNINVNCRLLPPAFASKTSPRPHVTFQSLPAQILVPAASEIIKENQGVPKPGPKKDQIPNGEVLECLREESCFHCPIDPHLLEPMSGFQKHLRHQILNSPLPQSRSYFPLRSGTSLPASQDSYGSLVERTMELCNSRGKRLPRITMTCPTPSPKHFRHTQNRHMA